MYVRNTFFLLTSILIPPPPGKTTEELFCLPPSLLYFALSHPWSRCGGWDMVLKVRHVWMQKPHWTRSSGTERPQWLRQEKQRAKPEAEAPSTEKEGRLVLASELKYRRWQSSNSAHTVLPPLSDVWIRGIEPAPDLIRTCPASSFTVVLYLSTS